MKDINVKSVPTGIRAVHWVDLSKFPTVVSDDDYFKEIESTTQTSVIQCEREPNLDCYYISIKHKTVSQTVNVSILAMQEHREHAINYAMQEMYHAFDDGPASLQIIKRLFCALFGDIANQSEPPKSITEKYSVIKKELENGTIPIYEGKYLTPFPYSIGTHTTGSSVSNSLGAKSFSLPGVTEMVRCPVTGRRNTLRETIMSLNDGHKWTREQIADWLETLDIDITFKETT